MYDPSVVRCKYHAIMDESSGCMKCVNFVYSDLPGWQFDEVVKNKEKDEAVAADLAVCMNVKADPARMADLPAMHADQHSQMGYEIYTKKSVLNYNQVMTEFQKSPQSLRLVPYAVDSAAGRKVIYLCNRTPAFKMKFDTCKVWNNSFDSVSVELMRGSSLVRGHSSLVLQGMSSGRADIQMKAAATPCKTRICIGDHLCPTEEDLANRLVLLDKNNKKRRNPLGRPGSSSVADMVDDDDDDDGDAETTAGGDGDESEMTAGTSVSQRTPMKRTSSAKSLGSCSKMPKLDETDLGGDITNPHENGSAKYWIHELQFQLAFDDMPLGRQLRQSRLLLPKLGESDRRSLQLQVDLVEKAKNINYKRVGDLSNDTLAKDFREVAKAGAVPTTKLRVACFERSLKKQVELSVGSHQSFEAGLKTMLTQCQLWHKASQDDEGMAADFNILSPCLHDVQGSDKVMNTLFVDCIFGELLKHVVGLGEEGVWHLGHFAHTVPHLLEIPEDGDIADDCACSLLSAITVCQALALLQSDQVTSDTDVASFDALDALDKATAVVDCSKQPMSITAHIVRESPYWSKRLSIATRNSKLLRVHVPAMKALHAELQQAPKEPTPESITKVEEAVVQLAFWTEAIPTKSSLGKIEAVMWSLLDQWAGVVLHIENDKYKFELPTESRCIYLHRFQKMLASMSRISPLDTTLLKLQGSIKVAMVHMDLDSKYSMCRQAAKTWSPVDSEPTLKLKDALMAVGQKQLPGDICQELVNLFMRVFDHLAQQPQDDFLSETDAHSFSLMDLVGQNVCSVLGEKYKTISDWLHAAWRVTTLSKEVSLFAVPAGHILSSLQSDKSCKELMRAKQRVEFLSSSALANKFVCDSGIDKQVNYVVTHASGLINEIGLALQRNAETLVKSQVDALKAKLSNHECVVDFLKSIGSLPNLTEVKDKFQDIQKVLDMDALIVDADSVEESANAWLSKANEYDLPKSPEVECDSSKLVEQVRGLRCVCGVLGAVFDPTIASDKIALRKKMRVVQTELKAFKLKPEHLLSDLVLQAYKEGLAMK